MDYEVWVGQDGNQWCALWGNPKIADIQQSPCGFGDTQPQALRDLSDDMEHRYRHMIVDKKQEAKGNG